MRYINLPTCFDKNQGCVRKANSQVNYIYISNKNKNQRTNYSNKTRRSKNQRKQTQRKGKSKKGCKMENYSPKNR